MATRHSKATRQGFMGLRSLRLAGFKTLFAGSRRQNLCVHMATRDSQLPGSGHQARFYGPWKLVFGRLQNPFRGARPQNLHMHMATRELKATRQGFMGLRSLRLAGFKTLFAGSRRQNLRVHMATRDSQATRQGFMGLRSLRLAGFKTLFAGSRPLNLRLHMATRQGFNGPASKAFSRGYPALRPPGKVLQGCMGLRNLRLAGFKTLFAGPGLKTFTCTWLQGSQRPPGKVLWAFEACVWPASKPFSRGPGVKTFACTWLQGTLSYPAQATRQGFMGLGNLCLAGFKTLFAGPGLKTFTCTWPQGSQRPPGKVLWAFEACVWPASKPFFAGSRRQNLRVPTRDSQATRQGFMGLRSLRLAGFKTLFAGSRPLNLRLHMATAFSRGYPGHQARFYKVLWVFETCVWPASKPFSRGPASKPSHAHGYKGLKGHPARFYGPSKLAFGRLQNPFRGVPASKPLRAHGYKGLSATRLRPPQARFYGPSKLAFGRLQNPFRGARPQNLHMHMATRESKATRQGFMGLRSLRLAGFKTLFAGSRPLNLRLHMATRQGLNGPASKAFSRGYPALRPPGKVLQGFMGLRNLRLAGFKTLFAGPGLKTFTCTWLQGSQRPPGKVLWAFEACVWPASKPFSRGPGL